MSTHAHIGIIESDRTIKAIYCHNDGYLEHIGYILTKYYNTKEKVKELIKLGNISSLHHHVNPVITNEPHTFDNPQPHTTVAYYRDRNEPWKYVKPKYYDSKNDYVTRTDSVYRYLFDTSINKWRYTKGSRFFKIPENMEPLAWDKE